MNITDLFANPRAPMTISELWDSQRLPTADEVLQKADDEVAPASGERLAGSFEHFVDKVRQPVIDATPCPKRSNDANGESYHWPNVKGTFADHAIVSCDACKKSWHVPISIGDEDKVQTGEPSERVAAYVPVSSDGTADGDQGSASADAA
jgi:hypothetical protein